MRLKAIKLENFRRYREATTIELEDLTAFIGRNDSGKSSILEALEIFFNNDTVKIESEDASKEGDASNVRITCIFDNLPPGTVIDVQAETALSAEHLLNEDGDLEIVKQWNCDLKTPKVSVYAVANHPSADERDDLLHLKNNQLKARLNELGIDTDGVDTRINSAMRQKIWTECDDLQLQRTEINLDKEDAKKIWGTLSKQLPVYALFQADRESTDKDNEVQDPLKQAVKEAIKKVEDELEKIKEHVQEEALAVAGATLEKLREMNPELAEMLTPEFTKEPKFESAFKLTLRGDDDIPLNKRGSGVRRLVLLNFFRAQAEKQVEEGDSPSVIYAIEEPETSQHPHHQKMLFEALSDLSARESTQVALTTHVPGLAGLLPVDAIRFVDPSNNGTSVVLPGDDAVYETICEELGVIPDSRVQLLFCVEGSNDIEFFTRISRILNEHDDSIPSLGDDPRIALIPLGGSSLKQWVNNHYLRDLGKPEIHIYDKDDDPPPYQDAADEVNQRTDGSWAVLTSKRETENYLHPDAIQESLSVEVAFEDMDDVPQIVAAAVTDDPEQNPMSTRRAKKSLNTHAADKMTPQRIQEADPDGDIERWLRKTAETLPG